jgi:serine/threonine protein kinase
MYLPPEKIDPHLVYLDPVLLERATRNRGLSQKEFCTNAKKWLGISSNTLLNAIQGKGGYPNTAKKIAAFFNREVDDLLAPWDAFYKKPADPPGPWSGAPEWESTGYLEKSRLAPNGLYYIVCRMQHRYTKGKLGRGKYYILSWLPSALREEKRHQLSRHANVCALVGTHPHIVVNHCSTPAVNNEGWWVIDEWVGETTVADHLNDHPWPLHKLPQLLLQIAKGLAALHEKGVILRELAPARVLIPGDDRQAMLTDFELAKLHDGGPSVRPSEWPEDPFRAPEVEGGTVTEGADLYSLAMVAAAAIAGPAFSPDPKLYPRRAIEVLKTPNLPKRVLQVLVDCLKPLNCRPAELTPVLKELARWAKG